MSAGSNGPAHPTDPWGNPLPASPPTVPPSPPPPPPPAPPVAGTPAGVGDAPVADTPADWWGDGRLAEPPGGYAADPGAAAPPPGLPPPPGVPTSVPTTAVVALIVGIISVPFCGVVLGPVAIWMGWRARQTIAVSGGPGNGVAVAAIVVGIAGLVLNLIGVLIALTNPEFIEQLEGALSA